MSSPTPSDISQNDAEILEKQWQEMQQRHEEEQHVRNRPATEPVTLKVRNVKLSFDIWLVLYMYFILYF